MAGGVRGRYEVEERCGRGQNLEPMGNASRDVNRHAIAGFELNSNRSMIGWRTHTEIHKHVVDLPLHGENKLGLRDRWDLEMESAHDTLVRMAPEALLPSRFKPQGGKFSGSKWLQE